MDLLYKIFFYRLHILLEYYFRFDNTVSAFSSRSLLRYLYSVLRPSQTKSFKNICLFLCYLVFLLEITVNCFMATLMHVCGCLIFSPVGVFALHPGTAAPRSGRKAN